MKNFRPLVLALAVQLLLALPGRGAGLEPKTLNRRQDPVQVPGNLLVKFRGTALDRLRLYALTGGVMKPVIFQFDERLPNGNFIFQLGEAANPQDASHRLEPQDFLVFRVQETGDRAGPADWPAGAEEAVEIELRDPLDQGRAWVYLFRFQPPVPLPRDENTVRLLDGKALRDPQAPFVVESDYYHLEGRVNTIRGKSYKTVINQVFRVPKAAGGTDQNLLDAQKMRTWADLFFGRLRVEFNQQTLIGGIAGLTQGRVRGYGRQWLTIPLPFGIPAPRIYSDVITYDRIIVSPMCLTVPFNLKPLLSSAGLAFGYDFNAAAYGMRFYSPNLLEGATVDGKMSPREKALTNEWVPWFCVTGPQGTLIFRTEVDPALLAQTRHHVRYLDDLKVAMPPESSPGSIGFVETSVEMDPVKPRSYEFVTEWFFPDHFYRPEKFDLGRLQEFLNIDDHPLEIRVGDRRELNSALHPPPLQAVK